jgi:AcrR family transcriptional regulator
MSTTKTRTRAAHLGPERRRPAVLDAALEMAVDGGLAAVTIGSVATRLGVTRPVVYACYADRVELMNALLDREADVLKESLLTALHSSGGQRDPEAAFVIGFRSLLAAAEARPATWRLLVSGEPDPAVSARFRAARAELLDHATTWIRSAVERWWDIADLDRKIPVLMELFMASCEAAIRSLLDEENPWSADELGALVGAATTRMFSGA